MKATLALATLISLAAASPSLAQDPCQGMSESTCAGIAKQREESDKAGLSAERIEKAKRTSLTSSEMALIAAGQDLVAHDLKDPSSAQFRDVYINVREDGSKIVCGEINASNSYGAYGGFRRFYSFPKGPTSMIEQHQDAIFPILYPKVCQSAGGPGQQVEASETVASKPEVVKPALKPGSRVFGVWTVKIKVDPMTDRISCAGYHKASQGIQLADRSMYITVRGGIESVTLRFDQLPPNDLRPADESEKRVDAIRIAGAELEQARAAKRLRYQSLTLIRGIEEGEVDLTGAAAAQDFIAKNCS